MYFPLADCIPWYPRYHVQGVGTPRHTHPLDIPTPRHTLPLDIPIPCKYSCPLWMPIPPYIHPPTHPWTYQHHPKGTWYQRYQSPRKDMWRDRHLWKHYLPTTLFAGGNNKQIKANHPLVNKCEGYIYVRGSLCGRGSQESMWAGRGSPCGSSEDGF